MHTRAEGHCRCIIGNLESEKASLDFTLNTFVYTLQSAQLYTTFSREITREILGISSNNFQLKNRRIR